MNICEYCGKEIITKYGSGRFCSKECARAFSGKSCKNEQVYKVCVRCEKQVEVNVHFPTKYVLCDDCKILKKFEIQELKRLQKTKTLKEKIKTNKIQKRSQRGSKKSSRQHSNITVKSNCKFINCPKCEDCVFKPICISKNGISQKIGTLYKYFSERLDYNKLFDYCYISKEYLNIKQDIQNLIDTGFSGNEICKNLFGSYKSGNTIFSILQCKTRNLSESIKTAILQGKLVMPSNIDNYKFKQEWHTTWEGKNVFLRSSYEILYANELDSKQIKYDVESLKIKYFDTQKNTFRCAIPDFYLPDNNMIIEIKSSFTYDEQNMKDKFAAYRNLGYTCKCICDWVEIEI